MHACQSLQVPSQRLFIAISVAFWYVALVCFMAKCLGALS